MRSVCLLNVIVNIVATGATLPTRPKGLDRMVRLWKEGKAKVLNDRELSRAANSAKKKAHAKRNVALLYVSFGLGLRSNEMGALKLKHVLDADHML